MYPCVVFVAQWIRHPPTKREIAGSSPVEDFFHLLHTLTNILRTQQRIHTLYNPSDLLSDSFPSSIKHGKKRKQTNKSNAFWLVGSKCRLLFFFVLFFFVFVFLYVLGSCIYVVSWLWFQIGCVLGDWRPNRDFLDHFSAVDLRVLGCGRNN